MSIKTKIATLAIAALAVTGGIAATTQEAAAGPKGALAAGLIGAAVVGTAIAASSPSYAYGYRPHRHCRWVNQYNAFGYYVGKARVCHFH